MIKAADDFKTGAVMVIGGGIGGIQAALDLADSGQKVYLLESSPAIGGVMARLDKTFPTNDCSMCILSPKLVEAARHLNIELLTYSDLLSVTGQAGRYRVRVKHKPRYVDADKCTGCGDCELACPVAVPNEYEENTCQRKAIYRPYAQGVPNIFTIEKAGEPPCQQACPASVPVQGYIALIQQGKYAEALAIVREKMVFPAVCGRVCVRFCEGVCTRNQIDSPVDIMHLKRFISDWELEHADEVEEAIEQPGVTREEKIAVIGAGPAGLQAAANLTRQGYAVTVFEALPAPGGMMRYGIPDYRLPKDQLDLEIDIIRKLGVDIRCGVKIGEDITLADLRKDYAGVLLAVGAHVGSKMGLDGEDDTAGVCDGVEFLRNLAHGQSMDIGEKVVVAGGGNAAIDAARTSVRLGKKVTVVYRRTRSEMPADDREVEEAIEEGVEFLFLANPTEILSTPLGGAKKITAVRCQRMKLGKPDESGRRRPVPIEGDTFELQADALIPAIGQKPELTWLGDELKTTRWGTLDVDEKTLATSMEGVFAGGDAVSGPASVIEAIAHGNHASENMHRYLRGQELLPPRESAIPIAYPDLTGRVEPEVQRVDVPMIDLQQRTSTFDEVETGYTAEDVAIEAQRCMQCGICSNCQECVRACKADAIDHSQVATYSDIDVGSIILCPGAELFSKQANFDLGGSRYADVITSMEFERILSASGPTGGHVVRPSDGKVPAKVAFLQCVGSRDISCHNGYCSSVCCMYAVKEAVIAHEHEKRVHPTIFFMDVRAYGKDFDKYCTRAQEEYGVRFERSRVYNIERDEQSGQLVLQYTDAKGQVARENFDMVVQSVGFTAPAELRHLANKLGVRCDEYGFVWTDPDFPLQTSREGIFAAGVAAGPKDIPETVVQSSAAACQAGRLLSEAAGTLTREPEYPPEMDLSAEAPRIGVFVCHCGINIGGVVDVPSVAEYSKSLPGVVHAEENLYTCSQDTQEHIRDVIIEKNLNRVVVASCTPRTHEALFRETLREAGLNPDLFAMTNIRDQCSWAHMNEPEAATAKAMDLLRMVAAKARLLKALHAEKMPVIQKALVIGGGASGMHAAMAIADRGYEVFLVEKEKELGGNLRQVRTGFDGQDYGRLLDECRERLGTFSQINVCTDTTVEEVGGFVGNFKTKLSDGQEIDHGVVVVATGAKAHQPTDYLASDPSVITQLDLHQKLADGETIAAEKPSRIVMIQCVGSRTDEHPWCSRLCCTRAVINAADVKKASPETDVVVLYRDIRTYGSQETHYQRARELGVNFIRFEADAPPVVKRDKAGLVVSITEGIIGQVVDIPADLVVLSTGVEPDVQANDALGKQLKVPVNDEGFFLEAHVKLRPVEFATDGIFLAGLAHSPKNAGESIAQALAAGSRACSILERTEIAAQGAIAECDPDACVACGLCEHLCPYNAITVESQRIGREDKTFAKVNPAICKGCGACVAACRSNALDLRGFTNQQILAEIMEL